MHLLASLSYTELREMTSPKFTAGPHRNALVPVLAVTALVAGYFVWLYYKEWQMKRKFRRYWEGKDRKPGK
jgi:hypothetical protein